METAGEGLRGPHLGRTPPANSQTDFEDYTVEPITSR